MGKPVPLLELKGVRAGYGDAVVLDDVSLEVPRNGSLAVLGRNGVGKSTLLLTIMGYTRLHAGTILFNGTRYQRRSRRTAARSSASAGWRRSARSFPRSRSRRTSPSPRAPGAGSLGAVYELFPRLKERKRNMGNQLSGGEQQMLAIARALMTNPALLLLDEPLEGLAPVIVETLADAFKKLSAEKTLSLVLVDPHTEIALSLTQDAVRDRARPHRAPRALGRAGARPGDGGAGARTKRHLSASGGRAT